MENQQDKEACPVTKQEFNDRLAFEAVYYGCDTQNLKSLENISDEDYNELMDFLETHMPEYFISAIVNNGSFSINVFKSFRALDYLRSRGYLLPFRQYSTKQIISMGWVKIN